MEITSVVLLIVGLLIGAVLGAVVGAWAARRVADAAHRAREEGHAHELARDAADARAELAEARRDASDARAEASQARAENAQLRELRAEAGTEIAEARTQASEARAELADVSAQLAGMRAQRDAAVQRAEHQAQDRESMVNQFKVLSGESLERQGRAADRTAEERLKRTEEVVAPLRELLQQYQTRLTEVEKERVAMTTDLRNQVRAVHATSEHLRNETRALATALRKPQVRGSWGEAQLRRIAEYAGMVERCDFDTQTTTDTSAERRIRPDMRVNLTNGRHVFVDAKVPLSAFLDAHEATDEATREAKLRLFAKNVRAHIDQLSAKEYWKADVGTPEFVVLFLPNETFLFAALELQPDLHEYAASRNIVVGTPNTIIAMLRAVAFGWKQVALANDAAKVLELGRELHARIATMGDHVLKTGRSLGSAVKAYNDMVGSLEGRVLPSARKFRDMKVTDADLKEITGVDAHPRALTADEFDAPEVSELPERRLLSRRSPRADELVDPHGLTDADTATGRDDQRGVG